MLAVVLAAGLGVSVHLAGCGPAPTTTTTASKTTTTTTTRAGAQPRASLGSIPPDGSNGKAVSLLQLQSGALAAGYQVASDYVELFSQELWEDALEKNRTDVACSATLALQGFSLGSGNQEPALQELQGGILAAGTNPATDPDLSSYVIYLFDSALIDDALTNHRMNVTARANLAVRGQQLIVHTLQQLQGGHLAVAVSSGTEGEILLFDHAQIEDAVATSQTGVEARASLAGWEVGELDLQPHFMQILQGGHLAAGIKGGVLLFDRASIEDALANNRTDVPATATLAGPTSDTDTSALEELQGGHLAVGTGYLRASPGGILLFEHQVIEDALSNSRTGVQAGASLACGSPDGCSFYALEELQGGLAAGDYDLGVLLFGNASIEDALANSRTDVVADGMLAGNDIQALQELQGSTAQGGSLAVTMRGHSFPVFSRAIIKNAFAGNEID